MGLKFMDGYKTITGAIGMILAGALMIIKGFNFETMTVSGDGINEGIGMIGLGMAALGIGGKFDKARK